MNAATRWKAGIALGAVAVAALVVWAWRAPNPEPIVHPAAVEADDPARPFTPKPVAKTEPARDAAPTRKAEDPPLAAAPTPIPRMQAVRGTVRDAHGRPIAGARVVALRTFPYERIGADRIATTITEHDGTFVLPLSEPATIEAGANGHFSDRRRAAPGDRVDFRLGIPATLAGCVRVEPGSTPCRAGRVALYAWRAAYDFNPLIGLHDASWNPAAMAEIDDGGAYRFDDVRPGRYAAIVLPREHPEVRTGFGLDLAAGVITERDFFVAAGTHLTGRVVDRATREPIAGARVSIAQRARCVTTNDDGRFEIRARPAGRLVVEHDAYLRKRIVPFKHRCERFECEIALDRRRVLRGTVLDASGMGLANCRVVAVRPTPDPTMARSGPAAVADARGRFALGIASETGLRRLVAERADGAWAESAPLTDAQRAGAEPIPIRVLDPGAVRGRLDGVEANDRHDVAVRLTAPDRPERPVASVRVDDHGRYAFERVPPGRWRVDAQPDERLRARGLGASFRVVDVQSGADAACDLALTAGRAIRGRVLDASGRGVAGARIFGVATDPSLRNRFRERVDAVSGTDGSFSIRGLPQDDLRYKLSATCDGYAEVAAEPLTVRAGAADVVLTMDALHAVEGAVVDATGQPVRIGVVIARLVDERRGRRGGRVVGRFNDANGRFRLRLRDGWHTLDATTPDGRHSLPATIDAAGPGSVPFVTLRVAGTSGLAGVVRHPDGQVVAGGRVVVESTRAIAGAATGATPDTRRWTGTIDRHGRYRIDAALPSHCRVEAVIPSAPHLHGHAMATIRPGVETRCDVQLAAGGQLRVEVVDARNAPVADAEVIVVDRGNRRHVVNAARYRDALNAHLRSGRGGPQRFLRAFRRTDETGTSRARFLRAGTYTVRARADGFGASARRVRVVAGEEQRCRLRLRRE